MTWENCPGCQGSCRNSGFARTDSASTGLALLCFLGAGYTHREGPYQDAITKGLYFLTQQMVITPHGGDLRGRRGGTGPSAEAVEINRDRNFIEKDGMVMVNQGGVGVITRAGDMYSQGIATLALCEAYGMTGDGELKGAAEEAVEFIINAQYPSGGWRYDPKWELIPDGSEYEKNVFLQADTTITGWQVTALKSALLAGIRIPRPLWYRVGDYLDSVQGDGGSTYGYKSPEKNMTKNRTTSIIGLFCRMMLGWPNDYRPLQKGLGRIASESATGQPHVHELLRQPDPAPHGRSRLGAVEPADARLPRRHAEPRGARARELVLPGRVERLRRPALHDQHGDPHPRGLLPLPADVR